MREEYLFSIPGWDGHFFSIGEDLRRYDAILADAFREAQAHIDVGVVNIFRQKNGYNKDYTIPMGRMTVGTAALKFGIDLEQK